MRRRRPAADTVSEGPITRGTWDSPGPRHATTMRMLYVARLQPRPGCGALRITLLLALAAAGPLALRAAPPASPEAAPDYALCSRLLGAARSPAAEERVVATAGLGACPTSPDVARLLERAIREDEAPVRAAAWKSLGAHLDRASLDFLLSIPASARLTGPEEVFFYKYASELAAPGDAPRLGALFERGLYRPDPEIQSAALMGLGRSQDRARWPALRAFLERGSVATLPAALAGARLMQAPDSVNFGLQYLSSSQARVQAEAIRLLGALGGPRALEALILLDRRAGAGPNAALLAGEISALFRSGRLAGEILITTAPVRLYAAPTEQSSVTGALDSERVVYALAPRGREQRIQPRAARPLVSGSWILVSASSGLQGWAHDSRLAAYAPSAP